ncbi:mandelate racemase/muconate lactonizing enzyme family protein [Saccharopolyspora sp. K220]|uniref:mandelate racemase/muconate lactonizing enzyme family protein n=1 Tax=Saccharopolyspora soli TaxID=2926618 RepID=UPI001F58F528|nr:mandelate racemase/muconate lactonizing enzyme family protein [Saccharopolyspora soli]MCI2416788.1 mandelate racemase/muconate lactonizing enzyme family protein [Saccharopolyspora soli]
MSRINSIETYVGGRVCVVHVTTDDGLEGWGQTAPAQPDISAHVLHNLVAGNFLGQDPWELGVLVDRCIRAEYKYLGSFLFRALSGVDTAIWDLQGKATGQPVFKLLGGRARRRIPVYASSMSRETDPEPEVERLRRLIDEYGFQGGKIKIGARNGRDAEVFQGRTRELVPLAREVLGDGVELAADANGAYSPGQAVRVGRFLEDHGFYHLEEPCPSWELDNIGYVADHLDLPIGAGEQEFSMEIIRRMVAERLVDVIQPDVCYMGGMTRARKVADMADIAGIPCTPHSSNRSMVQIFTAHLVTASPACVQFQEWSIEDQEQDAQIYAPIPVVRGGAIELDDSPGWGVSILDSFLEGATRQVSSIDRAGVRIAGAP